MSLSGQRTAKLWYLVTTLQLSTQEWPLHRAESRALVREGGQQKGNNFDGDKPGESSNWNLNWNWNPKLCFDLNMNMNMNLNLNLNINLNLAVPSRRRAHI